MAEFHPLEKAWLNVDKIVRVENFGTTTEPTLTVFYFGGDKVTVEGEDAKSLVRYLNGNPSRAKR